MFRTAASYQPFSVRGRATPRAVGEFVDRPLDANLRQVRKRPAEFASHHLATARQESRVPLRRPIRLPLLRSAGQYDQVRPQDVGDVARGAADVREVLIPDAIDQRVHV